MIYNHQTIVTKPNFKPWAENCLVCDIRSGKGAALCVDIAYLHPNIYPIAAAVNHVIIKIITQNSINKN